jgi:predicted O-methyltransferase YrrM
MEHFYQSIGENWFTYAPFYKKMVKVFDSGSHFVEIGSWKGRSSVHMAVEIINSKKLIKFDCVDTWKGSIEHINDPFIIEDKLFEEFKKNIEPVKHIINPIRLTSIEASKLYSDESLNFIFIDASHEYEDVKQDIIHWLPKLENGGIIAGHDIASPGVKKAVSETIPNANVIGMFDIWYIEKNTN